MFFTVKKEDGGAVTLFKKTCTYHGLDVHLSKRALNHLKMIAKDADDLDINLRDLNTLWRRGMIRFGANNETVFVTQIGLLTLALAEAGGLLTTSRARAEA